MTKKPQNFFQLKNECELLTRVAKEGIEVEGFKGLIKDVYKIREAITKLQIVARKYRRDGKGGELKSHYYKNEYHIVKHSFVEHIYYHTYDYPTMKVGTKKQIADPKKMCLYQSFKDLNSKNYLVTIRVASRKMANKCMKSYRETGAECCKRYYSLFRALEKQIHRLDTTLGRVLYELKEGTYLTDNRNQHQREYKEKTKVVKYTEDYGFRGDKLYIKVIHKLVHKYDSSKDEVIKTEVKRRRVKDDCYI